MAELDLVRPDDYGLDSLHYYFNARDKFGMSLAELAAVGVTDDKCRVGRRLIEPLLAAQSIFNDLGYGLVIKDSYRSPELYQLIYDKRVSREGGAHFGQENTDKLLNMERKIHASGNVVDIALTWPEGDLVMLRAAADGVPAHIYGYYQDKVDAVSIEYQAIQDVMKDVMFGLGFEFGTLREYWHFELPNL